MRTFVDSIRFDSIRAVKVDVIDHYDV